MILGAGHHYEGVCVAVHHGWLIVGAGHRGGVGHHGWRRADWPGCSKHHSVPVAPTPEEDFLLYWI